MCLFLLYVEVRYCMVTMQGKFVSFKHSINFRWVKNISICGSSSAVKLGSVTLNKGGYISGSQRFVGKLHNVG